MKHPLVAQLQFTRQKFIDGFQNVSAEDAQRCIDPMNSLSWIIGHLAVHELRVWVEIAQGRLFGENVLVCEGGKAKTNPNFDHMLRSWHLITSTADDYLDHLTQDDMQTHFMWQGKQEREDIGTMLQRNIYHYWYHIGEAQSIRQMLGHPDLIQYVGAIPHSAIYHPEAAKSSALDEANETT
ncbi:MAG: DinB family protein [Chloroflexota bacterium]